MDSTTPLTREPMETLAIIFVAIVCAGFFFYYINQQKQQDERRIEELNRRIEESQKLMLNQLNTITSQVNKSVNASNKAIGNRLDNAAKSYANVTNKLSALEEHNKKIYDIGKDISGLQQILKAPKLRGQLGELFLENLLKDRFSADQYAMQYRFKTGEIVDSVIKLRDGKMVPIDAKFPLENFKKMLEVEDNAEKKKARKAFMQDLKNRIDEIAGKYILPDEGTLDFALMYIPAENVYYEVVIQDPDSDIMSYAFEKNVFPVSPNTFAIYLTTILNGLRGLEIEKKASEIMGNLARLKGDFGKFEDDYRLVGKHLGHARGSYEVSERKLGRLGDKIEAVGAGKQEVRRLGG